MIWCRFNRSNLLHRSNQTTPSASVEKVPVLIIRSWFDHTDLKEIYIFFWIRLQRHICLFTLVLFTMIQCLKPCDHNLLPFMLFQFTLLTIIKMIHNLNTRSWSYLYPKEICFKISVSSEFNWSIYQR